MRKLRRLLFRLFLFILIIIIGIVIIKTITFSSKQISGVEAVPKITIDSKATSRFSEFIQLPTVSNPEVIDTIVFDKMLRLLEKNYPLVHQELERTLINEFSFIFKWKGKHDDNPPILLMGHTDVVPVEESSLERWTVPPFSGSKRDNIIWGRGTMDDKINVIGLLEAVEALLKEDYIPERDIYFFFGHDEEVSGKQGAVAAADWFQKNKIQFDYILDEGQFILNKALGGLEPPLAMIGIAEKGFTTLTITVLLKDGGHSSMPPSETAVGILSKAISNLDANPFPMQVDGASLSLFQHAGPEMNLLQKTLFANLWLTEGLITSQLSKDAAASALFRTTTAPTMIRGGIKENVLPTKASAKVNFRILPGDTVESVMEYVKEVIDDERVLVQVSDTGFSNNPSSISSTENFGFRVLQKSIQEIFPDAIVAPALVIAATDSRHLQKVTNDTYRFQPLQLNRSDLKRFHGIDENISVENFERAIRFYRQLILNSSK